MDRREWVDLIAEHHELLREAMTHLSSAYLDLTAPKPEHFQRAIDEAATIHPQLEEARRALQVLNQTLGQGFALFGCAALPERPVPSPKPKPTIDDLLV